MAGCLRVRQRGRKRAGMQASRVRDALPLDIFRAHATARGLTSNPLPLSSKGRDTEATIWGGGGGGQVERVVMIL